MFEPSCWNLTSNLQISLVVTKNLSLKASVFSFTDELSHGLIREIFLLILYSSPANIVFIWWIIPELCCCNSSSITLSLQSSQCSLVYTIYTNIALCSSKHPNRWVAAKFRSNKSFHDVPHWGKFINSLILMIALSFLPVFPHYSNAYWSNFKCLSMRTISFKDSASELYVPSLTSLTGSWLILSKFLERPIKYCTIISILISNVFRFSVNDNNTCFLL